MKNSQYDLKKLRQLIAKQLNLNSVDDNTWILLGTVGCHLCDDAEHTVSIFTGVHPVPLIKADIIDLEEELTTLFSDKIPVLLLVNQQLNYPFSVADLSAHYALITNN